ncbi:MAG TPA: AI-2E family transporter [Candidatus Nanoarchaeia archaeon]|nr:AI-2E family transporter [Candidatus Nanoarchaeia archaeon]
MAVHNQYQRIVPFIIFILALVLLFLLVRPMIVILLGSILLTYISFPIYKRLLKKIPNKSVSAILALVIIVIIILIPFSFLAFGITKEGYNFYNSLSSNIAKGALFGFGCTSAESKLCSVLNQAEKFSKERLSTLGFDKQLQKLLPVLEEKITHFILSIPVMIAKIFIALVISFYILKDWENILKKIVGLLPMRTKTTNRLIREFGNITHTVIYAQLFVALVQGTVATLGFYIFGVPFPLLLGLVTAFCALIPAIGTAIVWAPASLFLVLSGHLGRGIGLFVYSVLIISTIDNILLAKIVHEKAKVNQILVIVGVIGGVGLFGVTGIFIGPILLPLLITYFETFKERFV